MSVKRVSSRISMLEDQVNQPSSLREKINALNDLAWELRMSKPEKVMILSGQVDELSRSAEFLSQPYGQGLAGSLVNQAFVEAYDGNLESAVSNCLQAVALIGEPHSRIGIRVWFTLGWTSFFMSDYPAALENGLKALELARELGDTLHEAWALDAVASFHGITGDYDVAIPLHEEALRSFRSLNEDFGEMRTLNNLAVSLHQKKDFEHALEAAHKSLGFAKQFNLEKDVSNNSCTLADILIEMGRLDEAEGYLKDSMSGPNVANVYVLESIGRLRLMKNDLPGAERYIMQALDLALNLKELAEQANCHKSLSDIFERQGQYNRSLAHYKKFHELQNVIQGEQAASRLAVLKIKHQVESARQQAEIYRLKTLELEQQVDEQKAIQSVLEIQSVIDPLTGLHNRRYFDDRLEKEYSRHSRSGAELSLLMMDVDHFKEFNDTYGHIRGDECLRKVATVIKDAMFRPADVAVRYGGEEFICLLPETDSAGAITVAEHIRLNVMALSILHKVSSVSHIVTVSIGVATCRCTKEGLAAAVIARADEQLYIAKSKGRNRVEYA